jgi:uncharacterized glyoxalase superfamily protein PhnB
MFDELFPILSTPDPAVVQEPAGQPWGERMAVVVDPDGNRVMVASRAATAAS